MTNRASSRLDWLYTPAGLRAQTSSWRIGPTRACTRARPGPRTRSLREADPSPPATLAGAQADRGRPVATMAALALRLPGGPHAQGAGTDTVTEGKQQLMGASVRAAPGPCMRRSACKRGFPKCAAASSQGGPHGACAKLTGRRHGAPASAPERARVSHVGRAPSASEAAKRTCRRAEPDRRAESEPAARAHWTAQGRSTD